MMRTEIPLSNHLQPFSCIMRLLSAILLPVISRVLRSDLRSELQINGLATYPIRIRRFDTTLWVQIPQVSVFPKITLTGTPSIRYLSFSPLFSRTASDGPPDSEDDSCRRTALASGCRPGGRRCVVVARSGNTWC